MNIGALTAKMDKYIQLKFDIYSIIRTLGSSNDYANKAITSIQTYFRYDDSSADQNAITDNELFIHNTKVSLNDNVIPAIDAQIASIQSAITLLRLEESKKKSKKGRK